MAASFFHQGEPRRWLKRVQRFTALESACATDTPRTRQGRSALAFPAVPRSRCAAGRTLSTAAGPNGEQVAIEARIRRQ